MSIADDIRVNQQFDPTGENGGYKFSKEEDAGSWVVDGSFSATFSEDELYSLDDLTNTDWVLGGHWQFKTVREFEPEVENNDKED